MVRDRSNPYSGGNIAKEVLAIRLPVTSIEFYKDGRIKRITIDGGGWVPALQVREIQAIEEAIRLLREHPMEVVVTGERRVVA